MRGIIAPMVTSHGLPVFEPFTGGANLADLWPPGSVCSDIDQDNVRLYAHVQANGVGLDFFEVEPRPGFALYCDPPYRESTGYRAQGNGAFDHDRFDARAREWAKVAPVYVTEYVAREGWLEVGSKRPTPGRLATKTDRLFRVLL